MSKRKRLTNSQSEIVATYLPKKIQKDRKIPTSVKLVLANIYQLHYLQKNWGKRTVFRERDEFIKDIEAKDKNEVVRPQAYLMANDMVYINPGVRGRATEYTLNDELYELLPTMFKGELSDNFKKFNEGNQLNNRQLQIESQEVIVPSHNSMIDSELQHLNVPSDSETETDSDIELETCIQIHDCSIPSTGNRQEQTNNIMKIDERLVTQDEKDASEILAVSDDFDYTQYGDISEMVQSDAGVRGVKKNELSKYDRVNKWVSWAFDRLEWLIESYFQSWNKQSISMYQDEILGIIEKVHVGTNNGWFTDKQLDKFNRYINNYNSITSKKQEVLEKKNKQSISKNEQRQTAVSNVHIISDGMSESEQQCPRPAAPTKEEYLNALRKVFIEEEGWTLRKFYAKSGFGMYNYMVRVADILGVNVDRIDGYKFEKDLQTILPNDMTVEEPMVAYCNSVKEAQQQFAMALAANG